MRSVYEERVADARAIDSKLLRGDARICSSNFGKCWKALHPHKPAEALAAAIGCSVRTADYEISGQQHPSAQSIAVLVALVVPPWK